MENNNLKRQIKRKFILVLILTCLLWNCSCFYGNALCHEQIDYLLAQEAIWVEEEKGILLAFRSDLYGGTLTKADTQECLGFSFYHSEPDAFGVYKWDPTTSNFYVKHGDGERVALGSFDWEYDKKTDSLICYCYRTRNEEFADFFGYDLDGYDLEEEKEHAPLVFVKLKE